MPKRSKDRVNMIYADTVKELRISQGMDTPDKLAEAILRTGLWHRKEKPKAMISRVESGLEPSRNIHAAILAVLGTTPENRSRIALAQDRKEKDPGGRTLGFNTWFAMVMNTLNGTELTQHVEKTSSGGFGSAAVTQLRKGKMMVPPERIGAVFGFLAQHNPSAVVTQGKRLMLLDILRNEEKLEALLGNRAEKLFQEWIDSAFPLE